MIPLPISIPQGYVCPCPAHKGHHTGDPANPAALPVGTVIPPGTAVHVTGTTPSYVPGDRTATFKPDNGDPVINTFTVRNVYVVGDYDSNSIINVSDVLTSLSPPPWGMGIPKSNLRRIDFYPYVGLQGDIILSLEGGEGFRVWDAGPIGPPPLLPGQSMTNDIPSHVYIEALAPGTATLTLSFTGTGLASNYNCSATLKITVYNVELDIDNQNHWGNDYFTTYYKTPEQRALRDQIGRDKSKILFVNDIDKDGSGTPDYMDGWGCSFQQIPQLEREKISSHRMVNPENKFVPFSVTLENLPSSFDTSQTLFRFTYPESPPETMQRVTLSGSGWDNVGPQGRAPAYKVISPTGKIRIWKKDGSDLRNVATDYIRHNVGIPYSSLIGSDGSARLYLEAINASQNWSDIRIVVSMSVDNGNTWVANSAVRVTSMRCNFTVGVVRQYYQTSPLGTRHDFIPDYSTPAACLQTFADATFENEFYMWQRNLLHLGPWTPDKFWHQGEDAILGHGFVYFQYEGPNLNNLLYSSCYSSSAVSFDHKFYRGRTGNSGLTFWDYGGGNPNAQSDLAWWDICQYKLDAPASKYLVVKKSYTLHPDKANAMCQMFADFLTQPIYFGLHINPLNKGWGCLSNIGLVMREHGVDTVNMEKCFVNKDMPTTANTSVWAIIMGKKLQGQRKSKVKSAINMVVTETQGVPWGRNKSILGTNALQGKLFNVLKNENIILRVSGVLNGHQNVTKAVTILDDIDLQEGATDNLQYFDPGLFPVMFGEQPASMFDVSN